MSGRILIPDVLPDAQTFIYISDFVEVYDYDSLIPSNTLVAIDNVSSITYSVGQPNVSVTVSNNRIWFNGAYTTGNTENIMYFEPPFGNDIDDDPTIAFSYASVPPQKFVYRINQPEPEGVTVTHTLTVNYNAGGNGTFTIDRFVYPSIYTAYNFLLSYDYYGDD